MKTVFIICSPRKRFCASAYFLFLQRLFVRGRKTTVKLRSPMDHDHVLHEIRDAQAVVFGLPLYVDGIPSHVLRFLEKMEIYCRENNLSPGVYCIANNGFIEGKQNEPLMQNFEHFCTRAGLMWGGGVGIGGGVMLNVTRILFMVQIGLLLLNTVLGVVHTGSLFQRDAWINFGENTALLLFFNLGVLFYLARMGRFISKKTSGGKKYTRILLPSFIFILFADIFFIIISFFEGGLFRGWLSKKVPEDEQAGAGL